MGKRIQRKNLFHRNHLVVDGDLRVTETLRVGGNLTVMGDLYAGNVYCLGRLVVHGEIIAQTIYSGLGVEAKGDLYTISLDVMGHPAHLPDFDKVAGYIVDVTVRKSANFEDSLSYLADENVIEELKEEDHLMSVVVGGDCVVDCAVKVIGDVKVGGVFYPGDVEIYVGSLYAERIVVDGDLVTSNVSCAQSFEAGGTVDVPGDIDCAELLGGTVLAGNLITRAENGNIKCDSLEAENVTSNGSIVCSGPITCKGYLRAQGYIAASGSITAGKDHGILSGLGVPRSEWLRAGYVCGPTRPRNILTGVYRPLATRIKKFDDPRPARI